MLVARPIVEGGENGIRYTEGLKKLEFEVNVLRM